MTVPHLRIREARPALPDPQASCVLYWMTSARRLGWNFGLQCARDHALALGKPLVILEALRCDYPHASDRLHRFVLDGMAEHAHHLAGTPVTYYPFVDRQPGEGKGLLAALARHAAVIVTDDHPCFFLPRMVEAAARAVPVRLEAVDSNGLLPLCAAGKVYARAYDFRRALQGLLPDHLGHLPEANPLARASLAPAWPIPADIARRWPPAPGELLRGDPASLGALPIDHSVPPTDARGGEVAARRTLRRFLEAGLAAYDANRNVPDEEEGSSRLSPYLHFGHIAAHEVFRGVAEREEWDPDHLAGTRSGARSGWWGMGPDAEAFLDQLVTWRELGFNMCRHRAVYRSYDSLPAWARSTLEDHLLDPREHVYELDAFEAADTHDPLWNAAQTELATEGRIHNYLRMLWGKKILHWSRSPREALRIMITLNDRYALDGRDPNSYSGISWVLGRYDRAWGPERPIFGKVRYMSSKNTARKLRIKRYMERFRRSPAS